ncbi:hypothetical protein BH10BAC2_BH10BAC2_29870 [soil metagenome]
MFLMNSLSETSRYFSSSQATSQVNKAMPIMVGNSFRIASDRRRKKMNLNQSLESYVSIIVKIKKQSGICLAFILLVANKYAGLLFCIIAPVKKNVFSYFKTVPNDTLNDERFFMLPAAVFLLYSGCVAHCSVLINHEFFIPSKFSNAYTK